ncbi:MAG TPA: thioredoxin-dependent thiol peroxidase [Erysipelotrichaceae bacterium]|nr:thioredoxin-dependent thiol peroxidase [Erysipelotrichaceae bacterium]
MLNIKDKAPDFELKNQKGEVRRLSDYKGQYVVLYFYPKDNTPGCTTQACTYRDAMPTYTENNIKVFGISKDDLDSHKKFESDFDLNFELLSDESKEVIMAYDVWKEKNMYGKITMGVERTTFVVNPEGEIAQIFRKVDPKLDSEVVLKSILG